MLRQCGRPDSHTARGGTHLQPLPVFPVSPWFNIVQCNRQSQRGSFNTKALRRYDAEGVPIVDCGMRIGRRRDPTAKARRPRSLVREGSRSFRRELRGFAVPDPGDSRRCRIGALSRSVLTSGTALLGVVAGLHAPAYTGVDRELCKASVSVKPEYVQGTCPLLAD